MRRRMKHSVDKRIFARTARKTCAANLGAAIQRGGIRL